MAVPELAPRSGDEIDRGDPEAAVLGAYSWAECEGSERWREFHRLLPVSSTRIEDVEVDAECQPESKPTKYVTVDAPNGWNAMSGPERMETDSVVIGVSCSVKTSHRTRTERALSLRLRAHR